VKKKNKHVEVGLLIFFIFHWVLVKLVFFLMIFNLLRFYMNFFLFLEYHIPVGGEDYVKNMFVLTI